MAKETGKKAREENVGWEKSAVLYLHDLLIMLVTIMVLFLLVFRVIIVSGSSMYSTLIDGDYLLLISNLFYNEPQYGDIIVASKESFDDGKPIIKRVIATEGQTVSIDYNSNLVCVEDVALEEPYNNPEEDPMKPTDEQSCKIYTVPEGCVFVMGDNRNHSADSRSAYYGMISEDHIMGKVKAVF